MFKPVYTTSYDKNIDMPRISFQHHDDPDANVSFKDILALKSPCEGCALIDHCGKNLTACKQFYKFVHRGDEGQRDRLDMPSREIYNELFPEDFRDVNEEYKGY